uniref:Uncharacterized protein n=1 Tax=Cacopsylla melanoneura TaxID=428564 RepID=A0A8D9AKK8_9HEMI
MDGRRGGARAGAGHSGNSRQKGYYEERVADEEEDIQMEQCNEGLVKILKAQCAAARCFMAAFRQKYPRWRIIHDIYECKDDCDRAGFTNRVMGSAYNGAIFIISHHNNHWHVVHDCSYGGSTCRCTRLRDITDECRRWRRRFIPAVKFSTLHWLNLTIYLETDQRRIYYIQIAGRVWGLGGEAGNNTFCACITDRQR